MTTAVKAIYENGVFKPKEPIRLAERTEVDVILPIEAVNDEDDPSGWKAADELIGFIKGGLSESVGQEHDKHIYRR